MASLELMDLQLPAGFQQWLPGFISDNRTYQQQSDPIVNFFSRMSFLYSEGEIFSNVAFDVDFGDLRGDFMFINLRAVFLKVREDMRKKGENSHYSDQYIRDAIISSDYLVDKLHKRRINSSPQNCMVIDLQQIPRTLIPEIEVMKEKYHERYLAEKVGAPRA